MASRKNGVAGVAQLRYWRMADARVVVGAWRRSGQTLTAFARRHGIQPDRLRRWAVQLAEPSAAVNFHPVRLIDGDRPPCEPIEILLGGGRTVRVPAGFAAEDLERVLSVLAAVVPRC